MSVASSEPSDSFMPVTAPSAVTTSCVPVPVWTVRPIRSIVRSRAAPPPSSTCTGIRRGANSTTCVSSPRPLSAPAASSPSRPPPTTAPVVAVFAYSSIASRSSIVR
ncbi:hypothetical protein STANM309S_02090 [Streptomyces tanashiensis]